MKLLILIISLLSGVFINSNGQTNSKVRKSKTDCVVTQRYSLEKRRQFFPFNTATEVDLVSFERRPTTAPPPGYTTKSDSVVKERITLSTAQIDQLTNILYNYNSIEHAVTMCYWPRNAVIFYQEGKPIAFLEICFECFNWRTSPDSFKSFEICQGKNEALIKLFKEAGIYYGTEER